MTEYNCSCHIDGNTYEIMTCGAPLFSQAYYQFNQYVKSKGGDLELADGLAFDKVEVER